MDESMRKKLLWGSAAAVAAWAGWIVLQGDRAADGVAAPVARSTVNRNAGPMPAPRPGDSAAAPLSAASLPSGERLSARAEQDAFGLRNFLPPPPPPPKAVAAPVVVAVAAPPAPVAPPAPPAVPPLPYRFVGMLNSEPATEPKVFLSLGEKLIVAGAGDTVEGGFRLDTIRATELVFTHVQLGQTVRMPLSGAPS